MTVPTSRSVTTPQETMAKVYVTAGFGDLAEVRSPRNGDRPRYAQDKLFDLSVMTTSKAMRSEDAMDAGGVEEAR